MGLRAIEGGPCERCRAAHEQPTGWLCSCECHSAPLTEASFAAAVRGASEALGVSAPEWARIRSVD